MNVQIIRCISVLLIGLLFILLGDSALSILITCVGILLMIPGVYALISYIKHIEQRPMFPLAALGSSLLGLWLVIAPAFFISIFMYILGGVLIALGLYQLASLAVSSRLIPVSWPLYVLPILVLLLGCFILFNPFEAASLPFIIIGIGCIISSINDLIAAIRTAKQNKKTKSKIEIVDAEIVNE